MMYSQFIV